MATSRFLRLGLVGLLGLAVLCLAVMEFSLHRKKLLVFYNHQFLESEAVGLAVNQTIRFLAQASTSSTIMRGSDVPVGNRVLTSDGLSKASGVNGTSAIRSQGNNISAVSSSLPGASRGSSVVSVDLGSRPNTSVPVAPNLSSSSSSSPSTSSSSPSSPSSSLSSSIDHCKEKVTPAEKGKFNFQVQLLPDGSRPVNCTKCFYSRFPPLLQSCSVCNTGGGGGRKKQEGVVDALMVILTTHKTVDRRQAIRDTWASITRNNTGNVRHVFLLGRSKDEVAMKLAQEEHQRYGDIIMYDFMDSYANLTLKTLTAMHWAVEHCNNTRFIVKIDEDMWINVPALLTTLEKEKSIIHTAIGGACRMSAGPIRDARSKWYASLKAYPQSSYPGFCSGTSYATSLNVARHVIAVSPNVPFFYLEDVYMALCIKKLGPPFRLYSLNGYFQGNRNPCVLRSNRTITAHDMSPQRLRQTWGAKCP